MHTHSDDVWFTNTIRGFPVTLENPHVINSEQVWVGVAKSGPDNVALNSSYAQRYGYSGRGIVIVNDLLLGILLNIVEA